MSITMITCLVVILDLAILLFVNGDDLLKHIVSRREIFESDKCWQSYIDKFMERLLEEFMAFGSDVQGSLLILLKIADYFVRTIKETPRTYTEITALDINYVIIDLFTVD